MPAIALAAIRADGPRVIHFLHNTQALFVFSPQPAVPTSSRVCRNGSIPADARSVHTIPDVYILPENACTRNSDIQGLSVPSPVPSHLRLGQASTSPAEILLRVAFPRPTFGYLLPGRLGSPHRRRGAADEAVEPVVVGPRRTFGTYRKWPWTSPGWRARRPRGVFGWRGCRRAWRASSRYCWPCAARPRRCAAGLGGVSRVVILRVALATRRISPRSWLSRCSHGETLRFSLRVTALAGGQPRRGGFRDPPRMAGGIGPSRPLLLENWRGVWHLLLRSPARRVGKQRLHLLGGQFFQP